MTMPHRPRPSRRKLSTTQRGYGWDWQQLVRSFYGKPCHYCGVPADTVDHVVSLADGGTSEPDNLVPACKDCNSVKN
jgi:5-methylcytosine-specific restriction endonuclease McrA